MSQPPRPGPLPDAVVLLSVLGSLLLVFTLVWTTTQQRPADPPLQWRQPLPMRPGDPLAMVRIWTA